MFTQFFIVEGKMLGSGVRKPYFFEGQPRAPFPHLLVCNHCAEVWARFPLEGSDKPFVVKTAPCRRHMLEYETVVSGSIMLLGAPEWQGCWPDGALKWELERELEWLGRNRGL